MKVQSKFLPDPRIGILFIFSVGVLACLFMLLAALIAVAWFLNLTMTAIAECSSSIALLYSHADAFTQLLLVCVVGYCLARLARSAYQSLSRK